jgi:cytochrome P450
VTGHANMVGFLNSDHIPTGLTIYATGDVVMFWVMGKPTVLLGSMDDAHALLDKRMVIYGDRPEMVMAQDMVTQKGYYLGTARSKWSTHTKQRKIVAERLRAKALRDWAHPASTPEVHLLLQRLGRHPDSFVNIIKCFTVNVMINTTFAHGSVPNLDDPLVRRINTAADHQFMAQVQGRYWVDYFPPLRHLPTWLPGMGWKRMGLAWRQEVDDLYSELWHETKARGETTKNPQPCLVQTLIDKEMHQLAEREGTTLSAAMVDAGTETLTATTVVFLIIFMYYPEVLKKAQEQVDEFIGRDRLPTFEDVPRMPYITAMIREAFRWHTVAPIAIPHSTIQDDVYKGYHIPKGATVIGLSHHIHYQKDLYPQPEDYRPERFLDESGKLNTLPHAGFGL